MGEGFGLIGVATVNSAGIVGSSDTGNPNAIRVFDVAISNTGAAVAVIRLYSGIHTNGTPILQIDTTDMFLHSDRGYRFASGCFAWCVGGTATINYIREF